MSLGPAPESRAFPAKCRQSLSFSIDRRRGLCSAVIQVEAKLELSCVQHEAGTPWRIEHESAAVGTWRAQPRKLSSDHRGKKWSRCVPSSSARSLHSLCAGSGFFYFWGEAFFHLVAEVLNFLGYRT